VPKQGTEIKKTASWVFQAHM